MNRQSLETSEPLARESKGFAAAFSLLTIGAVLWPIVQNWREKPKDSFPLSYYPMFSLQRKDATTVRYFVGIDSRGERLLIPHTYAGSGGLNQVRRQINTIVRGGKSDTLAKLVAAKVAQKNEERFADIVTINVVIGRYRLTEYFASGRDSVWERMEASRTREDVVASCPVERNPRAHLRAVQDLA